MLSDTFPALDPLTILGKRRADRLILVAAHDHLQELRRQQQEDKGGEDG